MTVMDIRKWPMKGGRPVGRKISHVEQVCHVLGTKRELWEPPIVREWDAGNMDDKCVPVMRFPTWMECPGCGFLHCKPQKWSQTEENTRCTNTENEKNKKGKALCKNHPKLEQVPWVLVHADGHMADLPWHYLAHRRPVKLEQEKCKANWETPYLHFKREKSSIRICCYKCNAKAKFPGQRMINYGNAWRQPWIPESPDPGVGLGEILEVNDARVHSPITNTALVIPPESRIRKEEVTEHLYCSDQKRKQIEQAGSPFARESIFASIAKEFRCSSDDIKKAHQRIRNGYPFDGRTITHGLLLESEYQVLVEEIPDVADDEDLVTVHHTNALKNVALKQAPDTNLLKIVKSISHLVEVACLKEIMVLKGFKRSSGKRVVPPDIVGESSWLPALELYGEGVFFTINEIMLTKWELDSSLRERAEAFKKRFEGTELRFEPEISITPRFFLLHTLAHLLIRQLEIEAGYPAASLKERIYCTAENKPMSGILIYVAVPDVMGSLGGLAELAKPERFLPLLAKVFDHGKWCSLDPVCSEHEGQGPNLLNRAACHACALVPESCCAYNNVLLDRIFVKGDGATNIPAFLDCID